MQLTLDRSHCAHHPTACEGCLAEFLTSGNLPERGCLGQPVEDGCPDITIRIKSGPYFGFLVVTEENREEILYHGWMQFAYLPPETLDLFGNTASPTAPPPDSCQGLPSDAPLAPGRDTE